MRLPRLEKFSSCKLQKSSTAVQEDEVEIRVKMDANENLNIEEMPITSRRLGTKTM